MEYSEASQIKKPFSYEGVLVMRKTESVSFPMSSVCLAHCSVDAASYFRSDHLID